MVKKWEGNFPSGEGIPLLEMWGFLVQCNFNCITAVWLNIVQACINFMDAFLLN